MSEFRQNNISIGIAIVNPTTD